MNSFKKIALVTAAAVAGTLFVAIPQAQAAVTNGYVLSDSLAAGARGVTVLTDTTKAESGVNAVVVLTTSDTLAATADDNVSLEISGPATFTDYTAAGSNPTGVTLTNLGKLFTFTATTSTAVTLPTNVKLTVNGSGTVTVTQKKKVGATTSTIDIKTIYAGTTAKTNILSVADSFVRVQDSSTAGTLASSVDVAGSTTVVNEGTGYVNVLAKDAYAATLSTNGVLQASATNGAIVAWDASPSVEVSTAAKTGVGGVLYLKQGATNANKPVSTTITVSFNGTVLATKSITFTGRAASISVTGVDIALSGGTRTGTYDFVVKDSAGNQLAGVTPTPDTTKYTSQVTSVSVGGSSSATAVQTGGWTCASTSGSSVVRIKHVLSDLSEIYSNEFIAACGLGVNKYTVSLDKNSYVPGEIATLTISATDINGAKVADTSTVGSGVAISGGGMTAVAAPTSADTFAQGAKTYKFTVNNVNGTYNMIVDLPAYVSTDSAKVVSYKIADGAVSNAEVLNGIVALIASITKQIEQLQATLAPKKTITCVKGKLTKKVTAVAPVCPTGYKKK
jgi:trimeric autotransporter adhesin